jgi:outer membrane receptor protein involved in Fe transport
VFNLRYGFTQQEFPEHRTSRGTDLAALGFSPALVDLVDPTLATIPRIRAGGYSAISPWETGDGTTESLTHTFVGSVNTVRGRHSLRAGADFRIYRALGNRYPQSVSPDLNFTSTYTRGPFDNSAAAPIGQELASMLLGIPDGVMVRPSSFVIRDRYLGVYAQDDFQATPRLTLNLGLRYEIEQPLTERDDRLVAGFAFDQPNPIQSAARANYARNPIPELPVDSFRVRGGLTWVGHNGLGRSPFRGTRRPGSGRW